MNVTTAKATAKKPDCIAEVITLTSGQRIVFRALRREDAALLAGYFTALSADTRKWFAPHVFTTEQAEMLCAEIDNEKVIRLLAVTDNVQEAEAVAYFILRLELSDGDAKRYRARGMNLNGASTCSIAPSVADEYQGRGLGSAVMRRALALACRVGRGQAVLQGGVQAANSRAIRFYEKCGFRNVGSFSTAVENYDMIVDLTRDTVIQNAEQQAFTATPDGAPHG